MVFASIDDLRAMAQRRLPKIFFDYLDGAASAEWTAAANIADFDEWALEQRVLTGGAPRDLSASFAGRRHRLPLALGPVGFSGLFAPRGEILAARAAHAAGIPFCLSNFGIATLEELRAATDGPLWFQLYILKDRALTESFVARAERSGVETLCLTVDGSAGCIRERDMRNGFQQLTGMTPRLAVALMTRPGWCLRVARAGIPRIGHLADRPEFGRNLLAQATRLGRQIDPAIGWQDVARLRDRWKGTLIVKGILHVEDARAAADAGADAIVVSNHGGRDLDGAPSTISVLPEVSAAVGDRLDILFDSGVRRGAQIVKALALGAKGVLLGRAYAYGLAAGGQAGVARAIELLRAELDISFGHIGVAGMEGLRARGVSLLRRRYGQEPTERSVPA